MGRGGVGGATGTCLLSKPTRRPQETKTKCSCLHHLLYSAPLTSPPQALFPPRTAGRSVPAGPHLSPHRQAQAPSMPTSSGHHGSLKLLPVGSIQFLGSRNPANEGPQKTSAPTVKSPPAISREGLVFLFQHVLPRAPPREWNSPALSSSLLV